MNKYTKVKLIGRGEYGFVWLAKQKDGKSFAMKEIFTSNEKEKENLKKEIKIFSEIKHPYICEYVEHFEADDTFNIIREQADGGDLRQLIENFKPGPGKLTEEEILGYFSQLCSAVGCLHSRHIMHRDIKFENVQITSNGVVRLSDPVIGKRLKGNEEDRENYCCPLYFFSPELCREEPYNEKCEVWALGVLLYYLAMGKYPFEGNVASLPLKIINGEFEPLPGANNNNGTNDSRCFSSDFISLVRKCLDVNVKTRCDVKKILSTAIIKNALRKSLSEIQEKNNFSLIECGVSSAQGPRAEMENRHAIILENVTQEIDTTLPLIKDIPDEKISKNVPFFAVYDGHAGDKCAIFLQRKLHQIVLSQENLKKEPEKALENSMLQAQEEFIKVSDDDGSGSTVACVLIIGEYICTANLGDTEIVLSRDGKPMVLSERHNPKTNKKEQERVIAAGGRIYKERVGHPQFNPAILSLAVSRAIGDISYKLPEYTAGKNSGIIATPYTTKTKIDPTKDEFIIIGCDGLWDVVTYQEAIDFCHSKFKELKGKSNHENPTQDVAEALVELAIEKKTTDNVTVIIVKLNFQKNAPGQH